MPAEFFVAFLAPTSLIATKEMIRARLSAQLGFNSQSRSPAHMTIKSAIELTPREVVRLEDKIATLVATKALESFSAPLGSISTFELEDENAGIVYLPVEGEMARVTISYLLGEFGLPRTRYDGKIPHISLANVPLAQLPLTFGEISALAFPSSARFSAVSIFEKGSNGTREVLRQPLETARAQ